MAKPPLYDAFASVAHALANGRRAELIDVLAQGERSVEELAHEIGHSVANTSQHLQVLLRAGLLTSRRDGNRVLYRLASDEVETLWVAVRNVAQAHVAGIERLAAAHIGKRDGMKIITRKELARRRNVLIWDVRPHAEFIAGHVPGAQSVPPEQVAKRVRDVPEDAEVVAYCRGAYCAYADDAVRRLLARGRNAKRLEDGFPEWRRAGLPVALGASA